MKTVTTSPQLAISSAPEHPVTDKGVATSRCADVVAKRAYYPSLDWLRLLQSHRTLGIVVFCSSFLVRIFIAGRVSVSGPIYDQWHAIIQQVGQPFAHGTLSFQDVWEQTMEHRLFPTKLISCAILELTGSFDNRLEALVSAALWACAASLTYRLLANGHLRWPAFCATLTAFTTFAAVESMVLPFNNQYALYLIFTVLAILSVVRPKPLLWHCIVAASCAFLATSTLSSGIFIGPTLAGIVMIWAERPLRWRLGIATCIVLASLISFVPQREYAVSASQSLAMVSRLFAFPFASPFIAAITLGTCCLCIYQAARSKDAFQLRLMALAIIIILNFAALSLRRSDWANRYADYQLVLCATIFVLAYQQSVKLRLVTILAGLSIFCGCMIQSFANWSFPSQMQARVQSFERDLAAYEVSGKTAAVLRNPPSNGRGTLAALSVLRDPALRRILLPPLGSAGKQ